MRLIAVTLNAPSDWDDHMTMLTRAFDTYKLELIAPKGAEFTDIKVTGGTAKSIKLVAAHDFCFPLAWDEKEKIKLTPHVPEKLKAPVKEGRTVGCIGVEIDGKEYTEYPLTAQNDVLRQFLFIKSYGKSFKGITKQVFDTWFNLTK